MSSAHQLWQNYHAAMRAGRPDLAQNILKALQGYKGNPPPSKGGCAKCKRRLF